MDKSVKLNLGGQERSLNFGTMGFLKHLGQLTEKDPIDIFGDGFSTDPGKTYKVHLAIIHAALLADCDVQKVKAEFEADEVDRWVSCLEVSEIEGLILKAYSAMTGKTVEELKKVVAQAVKNGVEG